MVNRTRAVIQGYRLTENESFNLLAEVIKHEDSIRTIEQMEEYFRHHTLEESVDTFQGIEVILRASTPDGQHYRFTREMTLEMLDTRNRTFADHSKDRAFTPDKMRQHNNTLARRAKPASSKSTKEWKESEGKRLK